MSHSTLGRVRYVMLDDYSIRFTLAAMRKTFGAWSASLRFYLGSFLGAGLAERLELNGLRGISALMRLEEIYEEMGWGKMKVVRFDPMKGIIVLVLKDSLEGMATNDGCHITRGHLAGFVSYVLNARVSVEEIACVSRGDDRCEFVIRI